MGKKYVFAVYRETNVGKIDHPGLSRMHGVLKELHSFSEKLSFTQKELATALTALAERQHANGLWGRLKETDVPEWACTMSKRLRAACRDLRQGLDKQRPWASELLSEGGPKDSDDGTKDTENATGDIAHAEDGDEKGKDESTEAVQDDVASASADAASEFIVGWDKQLQKVFRMPKTELKSRKRRLDKEWTENCPFAKEGSKECDPTYVFFADEKTALQIPNLFAKDIDSVQRGPSKGSLGYHLVSGNEIALRRIQDRDPLCIVLSGSPPKTQICSVPIKLFKKEEDAFMLLEPIARRYMRSEIAEADLYNIRDEELKKRGIVYNKSQAIRKNATTRETRRRRSQPIRVRARAFAIACAARPPPHVQAADAAVHRGVNSSAPMAAPLRRSGAPRAARSNASRTWAASTRTARARAARAKAAKAPASAARAKPAKADRTKAARTRAAKAAASAARTRTARARPTGTMRRRASTTRVARVARGACSQQRLSRGNSCFRQRRISGRWPTKLCGTGPSLRPRSDGRTYKCITHAKHKFIYIYGGITHIVSVCWILSSVH